MPKFNFQMKCRLLSAEKAKHGNEYTLTVELFPNFFQKMLGRKSKQQLFFGDESNWRELPSFKKCDEELEAVLTEFLKSMQYQESKK